MKVLGVMMSDNIPTTGLHEKVSFADYRKMLAMNHSLLRHAGRSMAHLKAEMDKREPDPPSDSMRLGTGLHIWTTERERYADAVVVMDFSSRTKDGKAKLADAARAGKCLLTPEEDATVKAMGRAVSSHPEGRKLAATKGRVELVGVWDDPDSGVRCKLRADKIIDGHLGIDIKTTRDASYDKFAKSIAEYGYHTQIAFYRAGLRHLGVDVPWVILAVENEHPHGVVVYELDSATLDEGEALVRKWLRGLREGLETGVWPGYPVGVQPIGIPRWAFKEVL